MASRQEMPRPSAFAVVLDGLVKKRLLTFLPAIRRWGKETLPAGAGSAPFS